jgi:hypothetical protein
VYDVKNVSQPNTIPLLENNYNLRKNKNRVCGAVLGLSQDGASTNLFENFREISLKRVLSKDDTVNPSLFPLVNTFNVKTFEKTFERMGYFSLQVSPSSYFRLQRYCMQRLNEY